MTAAATINRGTPPAFPGTGLMPQNPQMGDSVPIDGHTCPTCGVIKLFWIYNTLSPRGRATGGWVLSQSQHCRCDQPDRDIGTELRVEEERSRRRATLQLLQRHLPQSRARRHTFLNFPHQDERCVQMALAAIEIAHTTSPESPGKGGLLLAGEPGMGKGHLLDALVNAAHGFGWVGLSVDAALLAEVCTPRTGAPRPEREEQNDVRRALRKVKLLAIKDVLLNPLLPSELRELDSLLSYREESGALTHFSAPKLPDALKRIGHRESLQVVRIVSRIERMACLMSEGRTP
jgi:DNA replication protein DnaC